MSALELIDDTLQQMSHELNGWRVWAAKRVCDCEALSQCVGVELGEVERHRTSCRYVSVATDMTEG